MSAYSRLEFAVMDVKSSNLDIREKRVHIYRKLTKLILPFLFIMTDIFRVRHPTTVFASPSIVVRYTNVKI